MIEAIRKYRVATLVLLVFEICASAVALIFYYFDIYGFQGIEHSFIYILAVLAVFLVVDCLLLFFALARLNKLRSKDDFNAATLIGPEFQEAYEFGQVGIIIVDEDNVVLWTNGFLQGRQIDLVGTELIHSAPELVPLTASPSTSKRHIEFGEKIYDTCYLSGSRMFILRDISEYEEVLAYNRDQALALGIVSIDNLNEVSGETDETADVVNDVRSELISYFRSYGVVLRRIRNDSYFCVANAAAIRKMEAEGFSVLEKVRALVVDQPTKLTLSCGFAYDIPDTAKLNDMAGNALDVALSRGGDQVVVSQFGAGLRFFGGKSVAQEATSKVKIRSTADSIVSLVRDSTDVFIMGHADADMDAIGSCLGIKAMADWAGEGKKRVRIVYSPKLFEQKARLAFCGSFSKEEFDKMTISPEAAVREMKSTSLLIVVDVSNPDMTISPRLLEKSNKTIVIDHHRRGEKYIDHYVLSHVDPSASSASELIAILLRYATANPPIPLPASYATVMLAGIFLDSNYFKSKATGARTFEAAEILKDHGADNARADDFLKDGFEEFELTTKIVSSIQTLETGAVYCAAEERQLLPRSTLAKVANQAMQIKSINAVFVIGRTAPDKVNISCRSDGTVNVQLIAEKLGGGGHFQMAAASFPNDICKAQTVQGVVDALKGIVEQYWDSAQAGVSAPAEP